MVMSNKFSSDAGLAFGMLGKTNAQTTPVQELFATTGKGRMHEETQLNRRPQNAISSQNYII